MGRVLDEKEIEEKAGCLEKKDEATGVQRDGDRTYPVQRKNIFIKTFSTILNNLGH